MTKIPANFLIHEAEVVSDPTRWYRHSAPAYYDIIHCPPFAAHHVQYTDIRTLQEARSGGAIYFETLMLYADETTAASVLGDLRQAIDGCLITQRIDNNGRVLGTAHRLYHPYDGARFPPDTFDESIFFYLYYLDTAEQPAAGGARMLITRRGTALVLYTLISPALLTPHRDDFEAMETDTAAILPAMCMFENPQCIT